MKRRWAQRQERSTGDAFTSLPSIILQHAFFVFFRLLGPFCEPIESRRQNPRSRDASVNRSTVETLRALGIL